MSKSTLNVFFQKNLVGEISQLETNQMSFQYSEGWLNSSSSFPISHSLPLQKEVFFFQGHNFFSHLLPEGYVRKLLTNRLQISESNDFKLLQILGEDCAGALQVIDPKRKVAKTSEKNYKPILLQQIASICENQPLIYFGLQDQDLRLSLAGAQDKIAVYYEDNQIYLPSGGAVSSHILKLPNPQYAGIIENEYFVTLLAKDCGLHVMPNKILQHKNFTGLLVQRYDRSFNLSSKEIMRVHQEDFCQALGIPHSQKYEEEGGPSFKACFQWIENESIQSIQDMDQFLRWIFFNICVGNCDHHGKNLSMLMKKNGQWQLSPFYDLLCTKIYSSISQRQAMQIGGSFDGGNLSYKHWEKFSEEIKFNYQKLVRDIFLPVAETILIGTEDHKEELMVLKNYAFLQQIQRKIKLLTKRAMRGLFQN